MNDLCHQHVIWGWTQGMPSYVELRKDTRCINVNENYTEQDAQNIYNSNIMLAQGRMVSQGWGGVSKTAWPASEPFPRDKYLVAILRWNPGMSQWDWQQYSYVIPDEKIGLVSGAPDGPAPAVAGTLKGWVFGTLFGLMGGVAALAAARALNAPGWGQATAALGGSILGGTVGGSI